MIKLLYKINLNAKFNYEYESTIGYSFLIVLFGILH